MKVRKKLVIALLATGIVLMLIAARNSNLLIIATQGPKARPMTRAILLGDVERIRELVASGADLDARDPQRFNWTPLMTATYHQQTNVIEYLLNRGVNPSLTDRDGRTALIFAIVGDDTNSARLILQKGSNLNENWLMVSNVVNIRATSNRWHALFREYTGTRSPVPSK